MIKINSRDDTKSHHLCFCLWFHGSSTQVANNGAETVIKIQVLNADKILLYLNWSYIISGGYIVESEQYLNRVT